MTDLAKRAVACKHWRWMPGMRRLTFDGGHLYPSRVADDGTYPGGLFPVPDLEDPATLGCLLALVREACGCPTLYCHYSTFSDSWLMIDPRLGWELGLLPKSTEAEALVAALEDAP
jgi:hypothetical protein